MDDPTLPSLEALTGAGHPFSLPWSHEIRAVLTGFDSRRLADSKGPWVLASPFDKSSVMLRTIVPDKRASAGTFRDGLSTSAASSTDHLSAAVGLTVGYSFCSAGVSAKYDKTVLDNQSGVNASRNSTCRVGCVLLDEAPRLSAEARTILRSKDGFSTFREAFGDYYICGYEIGADAGACLSASTSSSSTSENLSITATVTILFVEASVTHTESWEESSSSAHLTLSGFNTLDGSFTKMEINSASPNDQRTLRDAASAALARVGSLDGDVRRKMKELGLKDGSQLPKSACGPLCSSGLVASLLLSPYARMNEFAAEARLAGVEVLG